MHFISETRFNPSIQKDDKYYRIKESYRDAAGRVHSRILLNVGFMNPRLRPEQVRDIGRCLNYMMVHRSTSDLFGNAFRDADPVVVERASYYWEQMVEQGNIDSFDKARRLSERKASLLVDVDTVKHPEARNVGTEWICLQALRELGIDAFLKSEGWSQQRIDTALAHLIVRTVYSPSELESIRIMSENSAVCELVSGRQPWMPSFHGIYKVAPDMYKLRDRLDEHLRSRTDSLFNITNRIVLFDLTNFYFESPKFASKKAQFGRSKEKRSDCKLLVLALCVNEEGFIRYASILAGNTADPDSLPNMVESLAKQSGVRKNEKDRALVVIDAGIATEDNLRKIREAGYDYLCVSRQRLSNYVVEDGAETVTVFDAKEQPITLTAIKREEGGDHYLLVNSPAKAMKEESMNRKFKERFEQELVKARDSLSKTHGKKNYERVIERIGRAVGKYPSISKYYIIEYVRDAANPKNMSDIKWSIAVPENVDKNNGIYFLRTNRLTINEKTTWEYYNIIRDIECTNRQLKTDLCLRPIYHQTDDNADAHLYFGLLAYWCVNTIRYKITQAGGLGKEFTTNGKQNTPYWSEIVRMMSTQKAITTMAVNALGEKVETRICSEPTKAASEIYDKLKYKKMPFRKIKVCSTQ